MNYSERKVGIFVPAYNESASITRTLDAIAEQSNIYEAQPEIVVVDNNSTDNTAEIVDEYISRRPDLTINLIDEPRKGTGRASKAAVHFLLERGCGIIARTDADSVPTKRWLALGSLAIAKGAGMATGPVLPLHDEHYKLRDEVLWTGMNTVGRPVGALLRGGWVYAKAPLGANTFFSAEAYQQSAGYPDTSIAERDEDMALAESIYNEGWDLKYKMGLLVLSSMRRVRKIGYKHFINAYGLHPDDNELRLRISDGDVDIR